MERFLMSSPTQLPQFFIPTAPRARPQMDENHHQHHPISSRDELSPTIYEDLDFASELPEFHCDSGNLDVEEADLRYNPTYSKGHAKNFSVDGTLQTPFSLNAGSKFNLQHSRNVSLDDANYRQMYATPGGRGGHAHSLSLTSNSADPPSGTFSHSISTSTLQSIDSIPQLSSSMSNKSLLDSPYSNSGQPTTTPGRRKMSSSLSSNNLHTTPLRGSIGYSPGVKVGKTPINSHRRNRSKVFVEPGTSNLLASIANSKSSSNNANVHTLTTDMHNSNPFESAFVSPKVEVNMSEYDTTPLATPAQGVSTASYFTPIAQSQSFGGSLHDANALNIGQGGNYQSFDPDLEFNSNFRLQASESYRDIPKLARNHTLGSIQIENQDNDACKQLKKAKSFAAVSDPRALRSRANSMRSLKSSSMYSHSPSAKSEQSNPFRGSVSIDLLSPDMVGQDRNSALKSYPASIDLASITRAGMNPSVPSPSAANCQLLPAMSSVHSSSSIPTVSASASHQSKSAHFSNHSPKESTTEVNYPTPSQIQQTSTTEEIAKFAQSILKSDLKRPIVVQENANDTYDPKKKHKCPLCLVRFQRPEHVKRHLKSHTSEKPFECDYPDCGKRFNRKDNLKAHLKKIHG